MPVYRCDFEVTGDLVLPSDVPSLELTTVSGYVITFKNGAFNDEGHATSLLVTIIGNAESIDIAQQKLRGELAEQLDLLTFGTHSRFQIEKPLRAIDWEAGQKERHFRAFLKLDGRYPPDPEFTNHYLETLRALAQADPPAYARTALKYFRYGLLDTQPEDQFMRLWLALEIIAENVKVTEPVPVGCPACGEPLRCSKCPTEPTRVPMAKQAIEQLIAGMAGDEAMGISRRQFIARNGLMHGRSVESIEAECKLSMPGLVDELGWIAWHAIMSTIPIGSGPPLHFGYRDGQFANLSLIASMEGTFKHTGYEPHPPDDKIPKVKITLLTRFGKPGEAE